MKKNPDAGTLALLILAGLGGWMLLRPKKKKDQPVVVQVAGSVPAAPVLSPEAQAVERVRSIHPPGWRGLRWFVGRVSFADSSRAPGWYVGRRGISPAGRWDNQLWLVGDDGTVRLTTRRGPIFDDLKEYLG